MSDTLTATGDGCSSLEAEKPPTRKQVTKYLREAGLPGHISVTKPGDAGGGRAGEDRQGGGVSSRWRIETLKE